MKQAATIQFSLVSQKSQTQHDENAQERVILVSFAVSGEGNPEDFEEFSDLVASTDALVVGEVTGKITKILAKSFIGQGKLEAIAENVKAHSADLVVFNHHLSPSQERNIEALVCCRVLDRTGLILDIFSRRAQTFEGKLQVELAQLNYITTKLVRGWTHLERQKGGVGLRGPGETQLETDRRLIRGRIKALKKRLAKVVSQREQSRSSRRRSRCFTIALVGYTNAGKSTLFNALTDSEVMVADQLFATLDPTVRQLDLPGVGNCVVSDTVGFIRRLPHDLVAAFRATLTEVAEADLLLHVVDAFHPESDDFITAVNEVLTEIGADHVPQLMVMNKIDKDSQKQPRIDYNDASNPQVVWISAGKQKGIALLQEAIAHCLQGKFVDAELLVPKENGKLFAQLRAEKVIKDTALDDSGHWRLQVYMPLMAYQSIQKQLDGKKGIESERDSY